MTASRGHGRGLVEQVRRPAFAFDQEALAERRSFEPDGVAEDLGAGELRRRRPLGERGRRLLQVDAVELDPAAVRLHERPRFGGEPRRPLRPSARRRRRPRTSCTLLSWRAPTIVSPDGSTNMRRPGFGLRRDNDGTRTSKPAASSDSPVRVISSHASSVLRYTWPRRSAPARCSSGRSRSSRASSSATGRVDFVADSATSTSTRARCGPGPSTDRNHAPLRSGGSSCTTSRGRDELVTGFDHRWRRSAMSEPAPERRSERRTVEPRDHGFTDVRRGAHSRRGRRQLEHPGGLRDDRMHDRRR